jgi:hypothetical protein
MSAMVERNGFFMMRPHCLDRGRATNRRTLVDPQEIRGIYNEQIGMAVSHNTTSREFTANPQNTLRQTVGHLEQFQGIESAAKNTWRSLQNWRRVGIAFLSRGQREDLAATASEHHVIGTRSIAIT